MSPASMHRAWAYRQSSIATAPQSSRVVAPEREDFGAIFRGNLNVQKFKALFSSLQYGELAEACEVYDYCIATDDHLRVESDKRRMAVTGLPWKVVDASADEGDNTFNANRAEEIARYCRTALRRMRGLDAGLKHLNEATGCGLMVAEVEWSGNSRNRVPAVMHCIPAGRVRLDTDEPWRIRITSATDSKGIAIDEHPARFLAHAPRIIGGSCLLGGLLLPSALYVLFKKTGWKFYWAALELFGQPYRTATYPAGSDPKVKDELLKMLLQMGQMAAGVYPAGCNLTFHETMKQNPQWPHERAVEFCDKAISKLWIGAALLTQVGDAGGNRALGGVMNEIRQDLRDDDITAEAQTIRDQLLRPLVLNRFGQDAEDYIPTFTRIIEEAKDQEATARVMSIAVREMGAPLPMRLIRSELNLPLAEGTDEEAPLPGPLATTAFPASGAVAGSDRSEEFSLRSTARRALAERLKRPTAVAKHAAWMFAAIAAYGPLVNNSIASVLAFVEKRRTLEVALADLPEAFDAMPAEDLVELEQAYLTAGQLAGREFTLLKVSGSEGRRLRPSRGLNLSFEKIPFVAAIDNLRARVGLTPEQFEELDAASRSRAWRVAGVTNMDLLAEIHRELTASIEAGETARDFRLRVKDKMAAANGWAGENPWHADVVHYQNFAMAHAAGRYAEYRDLGVTHWRYVSAGNDGCDICKPFIGKLFQIADKKAFPPLHFNCDCEDEPVFEGEFDGREVAAFDNIKAPALAAEHAKPSGFKWDVGQYSNQQPINLSAFPESLRSRFEAFAREQGWETL